MIIAQDTRSIDDEKVRVGALLDRSSAALAVLTTSALLLRQLDRPLPGNALWTMVVSIIALAAVPALRRTRATGKLAPFVLPMVLVALPFVTAYEQAGMQTPVVLAFALAPTAGMFFAGTRGGILTLAAVLIAIAWLTILHSAGHHFPGMRMSAEGTAINAGKILSVICLASAALAYVYESQRKRREAQLRQSHLRYALAIEGSLDGLFDNDLEIGTAFYSERFRRLLGHPVDAALAPRISDIVQRNDRAAFDAQLADAELGTIDLDLRLVCANQDERWFQLRAAISRQGGRPARLAGSIRDISARKHAESMKDDFVASVSHELRTPLTSMLGALQLIRHGMAGPLPEGAHSLFDVALRNTERLRTLVNDLLDFRSLELGSLKLVRTHVDLRVLLEESLLLNRGLAELHSVRLRLRLSEPSPSIEVDPVRLQQIMTNLLSNACKFSPYNGQVDIEVDADDRNVSVTVSDQGPGVPAEFEPLLFKKFSQADSGDGRRHEGTGLGLAICKSLAIAHGGDLRYARAAERTLFELTLPRSSATTDLLEQSR